MTTRQKRRHVDTMSMSITTPSAIVQPSHVERLLGAHIHEDMRWKEHIMNIEDSLIKSLNQRQGAIRKVCKIGSFKSRKMLANGVFMSKLIYLMPVWAGAEDYLIKALQVIQNKVARTVTKKNIYTPTQDLMRECGWLTVRQLLAYHSLIQFHKTKIHKSPTYLYRRIESQLRKLEENDILSSSYYYKTRQEASGVMRQVPGAEARLDLAERSWCWRAAKAYHILPAGAKSLVKVAEFKSELKVWVKTNIEP